MNAQTGQQVDHINHNPLDNRRCNLRLCTNGQNTANARKHKDGITSQFKGVSWDKYAQSWCVQVQGSRVGRFKSEMEAARAYDNAARVAFGEFAHLNFAG